MDCCAGSGSPADSYALVCYIPGLLGAYLDHLRTDLVSSCSAQSHVSVLPPRTVTSPAAAEAEIERQLAGFAPFEVELTDIGTFEKTSVVYIEIGQGREELLRLHRQLGVGPLAFNEPFRYHPHITLAQNFPLEDLPQLQEMARKRWRNFGRGKSFVVDRLVFVRGNLACGWTDLRTYYAAMCSRLSA